ncbi:MULTISPECIES: ATP-binding protein [unclassified Lysobacter]|uniref:sensor histidine kinase n=1 Tax=unclassified Lysobacter TaxID=2635362 RepID=UPI001F57D05B|nr:MULTISPECIES: ATP-binding protein [unclassified Lysobacter]
MAAGRPLRLLHLLLASHVGLVALLALLLLATGTGIIHASLVERAQAQVAQAATEAQARLLYQRQDLAVVAGLLVERPTLRRFLARADASAARAFVDDFRRTGRLDYIGVFRHGVLFAESGSPPANLMSNGLQFGADGEQRWLVASEAVESPPGHRVVVARQLTVEALDLNDEAVRVQLLAPTARASDGLGTAIRHVLVTGSGETLKEPTGDAAAIHLEPVRREPGGIEAVLVTSLPRSALISELLEWLFAFMAGSLAMVAVAVAVAVWLARRIADPFAQLAAAAERLGVGNLEGRIRRPDTRLVEPNAFARSLEDMRLQIRALAENERHQRNELDMVLDGVGDGIVAMDADENVIYANRRFLELLDLKEADVIGRRFDDVLSALPGQGLEAGQATTPLQQARLKGSAHATGDYRVGGGARKLVIRSYAPSRNRQVAIVREETPAEASRVMRDAIVANLSHEFQTPIAAQIASIELLQDHLAGRGDDTAKRLVDAQFRGALRLSQLVDNLLDSVRLEHGELRLRRDQVDLVKLVEECAELMRPLTEQRNQKVALHLPASEQRLTGDTQRLSQVVINLLANANKFAPDDSTIWVDIVWGEETVSLWVEDEGPGIPPMARTADLFAPFRRAPDQEPSQRGTGLGLAIARALVERHGGEIVITEPQRCSGARFGVVLPLEAACAF